ncbi:MAG: hypothetical protein H6555_01410 [Lewinellaceae bacterium]|nr:hypothetical protein [Lewinellaceae bacterium]
MRNQILSFVRFAAMKKYVWLAGILLTAAVNAGAQSDSGETPPPDWRQPQRSWEWFTAVDGKFSVLTPGAMQEKVDTISTPVGPLDYHVYYFQESREGGENILYMVSYCDYPPGAMHEDSTALLEEFYAATMDAAAFSINGEVVYSGDTHAASGLSGKIWRIHYKNGKGVIKTRAFMVGSRYYAVQIVTYRELSLNPASDRFLDSFRVL